MNILVLFTGGTIGSSIKEDNYISTDDKKKSQIIDTYYKENPELAKSITLTSEIPYEILSEQLQGHHINLLSKFISNNREKYDGIIITHGTDTLLYSAAGLAILQKNLNIPVVLVSSNYVLEDKRANGKLNFSAAIDFIRYSNTTKADYKGVYVAYSNDNIKANIHSALLLLPHNIYSDYVYSLDDNIVGHVENHTFYPNSQYNNISIESLIPNNMTLKTHFDEKSEIIRIDECPGNTYAIPKVLPKAILLTSYHSGTICTENTYFKELVDYCIKHNLPIYLLGCEDRIQYETTKHYRDMNLIVLPKMSPILAYMMLWLGE